jgi:hypothetical protein
MCGVKGSSWKWYIIHCRGVQHISKLSLNIRYIRGCLRAKVDTVYNIRGLLEKYPTFGREKETGLPGALDT